MLGISIKYVLLTFILLQSGLLSWQLIDLMIKTHRRSDWKFLTLVATFLLFNTVSFYALIKPGAIDINIQLLLVNGFGIVLAMYYAFYLSVEFGKRNDKRASGRFLLPILVGTYLTTVFVTYIFQRNYRIAEGLLLVLPIILSIGFCAALEGQIRKQNAVKMSRGKMLMIYSSYAAIVLMTANPLISIVIGYYDLNISFINILFLLTVVFYMYNLSLKERKASEALNKLGFFTEAISIADYKLSERELEVASMILNNVSFSLIADELNLAKDTITKHASNIYKKTNTANIEQFRQKFSLSELAEQRD